MIDIEQFNLLFKTAIVQKSVSLITSGFCNQKKFPCSLFRSFEVFLQNLVWIDSSFGFWIKFWNKRTRRNAGNWLNFET